MKIERKQVSTIEITGVTGLDRIKVIAEDYGPNQGQLTIVCWGRAWSAYWGAMGSDITRFVLAMSAGYIADNLVRGQVQGLTRNTRNEMKYLEHIVETVKEGMRKQLQLDLHGAQTIHAPSTPDRAVATGGQP